MKLLSTLFSPSPVYAQSVWSGNCVKDEVATIQGFGCIFENIAQVIVYFAGLVFFIMLIKGGFEYITSSGDPKKTAKATSTLTVGVIGLVGVIVSFLILKFVQSFTGINVTDFVIPS